MQELIVRDQKGQDSLMQDLFWKIFKCENEEELHKLVTKNPLLSRDENWFPYGGRDRSDRSNFGTFENQQPNAIAALVEKITNSIDSLLMKECRLKGIDPKCAGAPKTMAEAVEKFFNIKNGDFSEFTDNRKIAENIQIVITDNKTSPNILIYDNGEGQHPDNFKDTFLSIARNNKTDIQFVQGKYNIGSTGAVVFCGNYRYQLIASKLNTSLSSKTSKNDFGFTLVRRHFLTEEQEETCRATWYEYFCPNNIIPRFHAEELDLGLHNRNFSTGSIIKLYSYRLPPGSRSDATLDLWRDLNQYLYLPALPVLIFEKRYTAGHSQTKLMKGNKNRIICDDREQKEETINFQINNAKIGTVNIEATVFKAKVDKKEFIKDKAVVFTLNGQVQGFFPRQFISQQLGLTYIKDSLLIQIDCTKMRVSFRQDLFMANRYNLKESDNLSELMGLIIKTLKANDKLKELNEARKNMIFHDTTGDKDLIKSLANKLPLNDELINLLKKHGDMNFQKTTSANGQNDSQKKNSKEKEDKPKVSKRFPSIFKIQLKEDNDGKLVKSIPLNGKGIVMFETDVENEYLFRPKDKGELKIEILGHKKGNGGGHGGKPIKPEDIFDITKAGPTDNSIKITFEPRENLSVGDEIEINARLSSPEGDLECIFYIRIIDPQQTSRTPKEQKDEQPNLPKPVKVYQKRDENPDITTWDDMNWTGYDIVKLYPSSADGESFIETIAVNMDSNILKRYLSKNNVNNEKKLNLIANKYFSLVYFHSLYLYSIFERQKNSDENLKDKDIDAEALIEEIFKQYSDVLLYSMNITDSPDLADE